MSIHAFLAEILQQVPLAFLILLAPGLDLESALLRQFLDMRARLRALEYLLQLHVLVKDQAVVVMHEALSVLVHEAEELWLSVFQLFLHTEAIWKYALCKRVCMHVFLVE